MCLHGKKVKHSRNIFDIFSFLRVLQVKERFLAQPAKQEKAATHLLLPHSAPSFHLVLMALPFQILYIIFHFQLHDGPFIKLLFIFWINMTSLFRYSFLKLSKHIFDMMFSINIAIHASYEYSCISKTYVALLNLFVIHVFEL